jgi:hypothetical protein
MLLANEGNRVVSEAAVRRFRLILRTPSGWRLTNDAVVIDREGKVRNGQHRLFAISAERVEAPGVPLLVMREADPDDRWAYDQGRKRGAADLLQMRGKNGTDAHVAIARKLALGRGFPTLLDAVEFTVRFWPAISFAHRIVHRYTGEPNLRGLFNSGAAGVVARAHVCGVPVESLERFVIVVAHDGIGRRFAERDAPLRWLREHVLGEWNRRGMRINQNDVFWATQTVLHHWLHDEPFNPEQDAIQCEHLFTSPRLK